MPKAAASRPGAPGPPRRKAAGIGWAAPRSPPRDKRLLAAFHRAAPSPRQAAVGFPPASVASEDLQKKYDMEARSLTSRSNAKLQWQGSVLSRRAGADGTDGRDQPVSRGSCVEPGGPQRAGGGTRSPPAHRSARPHLFPPGSRERPGARLEKTVGGESGWMEESLEGRREASSLPRADPLSLECQPRHTQRGPVGQTAWNRVMMRWAPGNKKPRYTRGHSSGRPLCWFKFPCPNRHL